MMGKYKTVYFDYNATTPVDSRVLSEMKPFFSEIFHNPSSFYRLAGEARYKVEKSRKQIADLIHCQAEEIYFTSGGTESDNMAIMGVAHHDKIRGNHIITSEIEHPAVLNTCKYLEQTGYDVTYLKVDSTGRVDPDDLKKQITSKTVLISIMHANNEIGIIQPIKELCEIAHEKEVIFHTDAVQSSGKISVDVVKLGVDMLSLSSHKIYGPKGVGVLFKNRNVKIEPISFGGGHEKGLRSGTENVPGIVGMGKAAELAKEEMDSEAHRIKPMRDRLQKELLIRIPDILINGDTQKRLYNTLNISVRHIEGEAMLALLDQDGFCLSSASACSSKSSAPSHVLTAIGLSPEDAQGSLRISLGRYNTDRDIDRLLRVFPVVVEGLRKISPFWPG
jgi:cysteine desulfurase